MSAPDWWPELVPEGYCLQLMKNIYGTRQAPPVRRPGHGMCLSTWMEEHGYLPVNNEKTIFMKWEEDDFIINGVFVDDFATIPTSQKLKDEFEALYTADFDVTGGGIMTTFLGLEVEQSDDGISLHLDTYIKELVEEYKDIHKKFIKPKSVPMSPLSSAEAEYYSASEMAIETIYLRNLLGNMGLPQGDNTAVFEDNTACIELANHVIGGRERAKHIDIRKHFAHDPF
jgi:hypothetical protein